MPHNENTPLLHKIHNHRHQHPQKYYNQETSKRNEHYIIVEDVPKYPDDDDDDYEVVPSSLNFDYCRSLTLAELLPYQDCPFWKRIRLTILLTFWLTILCTLIAACLMAYNHRNDCLTATALTKSTTTLPPVQFSSSSTASTLAD